MANYDILGNIAIVKFEKKTNKKEFARKLMQTNKNIRTVLEKTNKFSGRLRTIKTKFILGDNTKEALYRENDCIFRLNTDTCYFSPRLSSERLEIAKQIKKDENILVMFGGVAPFAIVLAKHSKAKKIISIELSKACNIYAKENLKRNKITNVELIQGDVRKKLDKKEKFDRIVMARPNLKDPFLDLAFPLIKKNGLIYYYGFYNQNDLHLLKELIENEAKKAKKKIKILGIKKAGDIAPYKYRYRADIKVLN